MTNYFTDARFRLRDIRMALDYKQIEIANALGITQGGYSDIERGRTKVSPRLAMNLKALYNVNPRYLLEGTGSMFIDNKPKKNVNMAFVTKGRDGQPPPDQMTELVNNLIVENNRLRKIVEDFKKSKGD